MTEREQLIAAIERITASRDPQTTWRTQANELFTRIQSYLDENRSVREIGRKGGAVTKSMMTREDYAKIGRKGGLTTKKRLGSSHYSAIGKLGGEKRFPKKPTTTGTTN